MTKYFPEPPVVPTNEENRALLDYVYRELNRISASLAVDVSLTIEKVFVAPARPQDGDIVYADGTSWNPGSGAGVYAYLNGVWEKLNLNSTDVITVGSPFTVKSVDPGAGGAPDAILFRDSPSPANGDVGGRFIFQFRDANGAIVNAGYLLCIATDVTAGSFDTDYQIYNKVNGADSLAINITQTEVSLRGTNTNNNAAASRVGEVVSASVASGSAVALTSTVAKTVTSISLTAGDWDVYGNVAFVSAATTSINAEGGSISLVTNTLDVTPGRFEMNAHAALVPGVSSTLQVEPTMAVRLSLSATTTVYLVAYSVFTIAAYSAFGQIWARRAR